MKAAIQYCWNRSTLWPAFDYWQFF